jgi:DDE superfamily endonuclease
MNQDFNNLKEKIHPHDVLIGDGGFLKQDYYEANEYTLLVPHRRGPNGELLPDENKENELFSILRGIIERCFGSFKAKFSLLGEHVGFLLPEKYHNLIFTIISCLWNLEREANLETSLISTLFPLPSLSFIQQSNYFQSN